MPAIKYKLKSKNITSPGIKVHNLVSFIMIAIAKMPAIF